MVISFKLLYSQSRDIQKYKTAAIKKAKVRLSETMLYPQLKESFKKKQSHRIRYQRASFQLRKLLSTQNALKP